MYSTYRERTDIPPWTFIQAGKGGIPRDRLFENLLVEVALIIFFNMTVNSKILYITKILSKPFKLCCIEERT